MTSTRRYLVSLILSLTAAAAIFGQTPPQATPPPLTPWQRLQAGNEVFATQPFVVRFDVSNRLPDKQSPEVTILSCADSRVPPELVFNQGLGQLFVHRVAGNVADPFIIGSIEYGLIQRVPWTKLIVVLGHYDCGAVKEALNQTDAGTDLNKVLDRIRESFVGIKKWDGSDKAILAEATKLNAKASAAYLVAHSARIRKAVLAGDVQLIAAYYDLTTGRVTEVK